MGDFTFEDNDAPAAPTTGQVSLDSTAGRVLPEAVVNRRAIKADYGLGPDSPGKDTIANAVSAGTEDSLRGTASAAEEMRQTAANARRVLGQTLKTGPVTQDDVDLARGSLAKPTSDPGVVFELGFGRRIVNDIASGSGDSSSVFNKAQTANPGETYKNMDAASEIIAKQNILETQLENRKADWQATSWSDSALNIAEGLVPLLSASRLRNVVGAVDGSILPGDNLEEQVQSILLLPPSQFKQKLEEVTDGLWEKNPQDAIRFMEAVKSYGSDDKYLDNLFGIADAVGVGELGVGAAKLTGKLGSRAAKLTTEQTAELSQREARKALKDTVKAAAKDPKVPEDILEAAGQVDKAVTISAVRKLGVLSDAGLSDADVLARNLPSVARVNAIVSDPGSLTREAADRLAAKLKTSLTGVDNALGITVRNTRMNPEQLEIAVTEAKDALRRQFEKSSDAIMDIRAKPASAAPVEDSLADKVMATVQKKLGDMDTGVSFKDIKKAFPDKSIEDLTRAMQELNERKLTTFTQYSDPKHIKATKQIEIDVGGGPMHILGVLPEGRAWKAAAKEVPQDVPKEQINNIIDVRRNDIEKSIANVETVTIQLGAPRATPFPTADIATHYAEDIYGLSEGTYRVAQVGDAFTIEVDRALDETSDAVRAAISTNNPEPQEGIPGFFEFLKQPNRILPGYLKSADENLNEFQNTQRKAVQAGFNATISEMKDIIKPIAQLSTKEKKDLEKVLSYNRDAFDVKTGDRGFFYDTVAQLEDGYTRSVGRLPTENEIEAYYRYTQLSDLDWGMRNFSLYRDKVRVGLKQYDIPFMASSPDGPKYSKTPKFDGKEIDNLPWNGEPATVLHFIDGKGEVFNTKGVNSDVYKELIKTDGYKVIQVGSPVDRPFKDVLGNNEIVQYVLTKEHAQYELPLKQLDYNPGGHVEYQHDWYIKQGRISVGRGGQKFYEGDTAILNFTSEAQTRKFETAMNEARMALKAKDEGALDGILGKRLPWTKDEFKQLFEGEGALDLDQKFHVIKRGRSVIQDIKSVKDENPGIRDYTDSSHTLAGEADRKFVGARNGPLMTVHEAGSDSNPILRVAPAKLIDPLQTMGRGLANATNNRFFGDYKIGAVESFIKNHAGAMKTSNRELANFPMYYLAHPEWDMSASNFGAVTAAMNERRAIMNFVGEQTPLGRVVEDMKRKLMNSIYGTFGDEVTTKVVNALSNKSGDAIDPAGYFRAFAFHTKLGMFNPLQFPLQAMGATHAIAISPKHGLNAAVSYLPTRWLGQHPSDELIVAASQKMKAFGWKPEDFAESVRTMKAASWDSIGSEHAWKDNIADHQMFGNPGGSFLDKGTMFFNEGEKVNRIVSWHTSYREWREANPLATLNAESTRQIINRADLLALNMTRASAASWQKGVMSIPTQFLSYNARMMDQFLGKRLTPAEKGRAFTMYSTMYGIPAAASAATGYTFYDDIRTQALNRSWDVDNGMFKALHEGVLSSMVGLIAGKDYNVASRYGPGGLKPIKELISGDKSLAEFIGGASGSILSDTFASASPLVKDVYDVFKNDGPYQPVLQDMIEASRNISSVNNGFKVIMAFNTAKHITKSGKSQGDLSGPEAIFGAITGLQPQEFTDMSLKQTSMAGRKDFEDEVAKEVVKQMRLGKAARESGDVKGSIAFYTKASAALKAGDINPNKAQLIMQRYMKEKNDTVDSVDFSFLNSAPNSQYEARKERFINKDSN